MNCSRFRWLFSIALCLVFLQGSAYCQGLGVQTRMAITGDYQPREWSLRFEFTEPVSVLDFSRHLTCLLDDKSVQYRVVNATDTNGETLPVPLPSERKIFVIEPKEVPEPGSDVVIRLSKALSAADRKSTLATDVEVIFFTRDVVEIEDVDPYFSSSDDRGVRVKVSRKIDADSLKKQVRLFPPVGKVTVKEYASDDLHFSISGNFETARKYNFTIKGGHVEGEDFLFPHFEREFVAAGPQPTIRFESDRAVMELKGRQLVPVSLVNVSQIRCQITRIPPLFSPEFAAMSLLTENDSRRPKSSERMRAADETETELASEAFQAEQKMVEGIKRLGDLKKLPPLQGNSLPLFLDEFQQSNEAFIAPSVADKLSRLSLPLTFRSNPEKGGAFLLQLFDAGKEQKSCTSRLFQLTDLSITYKFSEKNLLFWVTSLESAKPVANAAIMVFSADDKRLFLGRTDKDGLLVANEGTSFPALVTDGDSFEVSSATLRIPDTVIAIASTEGDSCFIQLDSNRFRPFSVTQNVPGKISLKDRNANVFTERGIYKPGETVFWKATLRKYQDNQILPPAGDEVIVEIVNSREEKIVDTTAILNEFGTCSGSLTLKEFAPLGEYTIFIKGKVPVRKPDSNEEKSPWDSLFKKNPVQGTSPEKASRRSRDDDENDKDDEKVISFAQTGFQVQFFEPPRHFVNISTQKKSRENASIVGHKTMEDYLECLVEAKYYTGGPVRHGKVRWTATVVPTEFDVTGYEGFYFGFNGSSRMLIESGESVLDKDGKLTVSFPLDKALMAGLHGVEISATVMDVDARPATKVEIYEPQAPFRVGFVPLPNRIYEGDESSLKVIIVGQNGQKVTNGSVRLEILRKRYFYTQKRDDDGNIFYHWSNGWLKTLTSEQPIRDGYASFDLVFDDSGDYQLQAIFSTPDGEYLCNREIEVGYVGYYDDDEDSNKKRRSDAEIILACSRSEAAVNDPVRIDFSVTRPATHALVTSERDGIFEYRVVPVAGRHGSAEFKLKPENRPNTFLTVTIPTGRSAFPTYRSQIDTSLPRVFYGVTSVRVQDSIKTLTASIIGEDGKPGDSPLHGRPAETKKVFFELLNDQKKGVEVEMAVCVVDEAVLALTGYVTPTLAALANFSLPLSVFTGDLRFSLITQDLFKLFATHSLTGGDGGAGAISSDIALRKDFRPVAYWNPALMTDQNGKAQIEFKLPDTTTSYRIYLVALDKGSSFCSAERQMVVTKEFFLQPGMPRFLTVGDSALFPLSACNKTENPGQAKLNILECKNVAAKLTEPLANLTPMANTPVKVSLEADNGPGQGSLIFSGEFGAFKDAILGTLPVFPKHILVRRAKFGHFTGSSDVSIDLPDDILTLDPLERKGTLKAVMAVSGSPWSKLTPSIRYLLQYPYGCVEQTSSGIIPLAGLRKLAAEGLIPGLTVEEVDKFLKPGINRLLKMQTYRGGFSYWPGQRLVNWWGTQYATFALMASKEAGYDVPEDRLEKATTYIKNGLFGEEKFGWGHDHPIYELSAVNLALAKTLTNANLEVLMSGFDKKDNESKAILLWAASLIKMHPPAKLKEMASKLKPDLSPSRTYWYDSGTRDIALSLIVTMLADPTSKKADEYSALLLDRVRHDGRWNSTADTGWCLMALGRYFQAKDVSVPSEMKVKVVQADKPATEVTLAKNVPQVVELDAEALAKQKKVRIEGPAGKMVSWSLDVTYPETASRSEDLNHGFRVEKKVKNLNGSEEIRVGDLLKVTVEFEDDSYRRGDYGRMEYLALEDPIPAGFMGINAALKTEGRPVPSGDDDSDEDEDEWYSHWEDGAYTLDPDHFEMHDDKILAFKDSLWSSRFRFTYFARAICEGDFWLRPTRVSLMYDPECFGLTQGMKIKVLPAK